MAKVSLIAIYLVLLVSLSSVYETQGTFSLPLYLKIFPTQGKDFESYAYKGMLDFMGDLEGKCPQNTEFKDLFVTLKDYMDSFKSKDIQTELATKSEKLFRAISAFSGTKGGASEDSWKLVDGLLSMGKALVEMKKNGSKEITFEKRKELIQTMVDWTRAIGLFVKTASESKGKSIDLSTFGIDYDTNASSPPKRDLKETQGTFSLPNYLGNLPKMTKDVEPFAYKGMSGFMGALEGKSPATAEFQNLFAKVEEFMACFKSETPGSIDNKLEMSEKSEKLHRAMSSLDGSKGGSVDSWRMVDGLLSMGKVLVDMKKNGSKEITFEQRKELVGTMVRWARAIGLFVKAASEKKGHSIDLSSFGIDYTNAHVPSPTGEL